MTDPRFLNISREPLFTLPLPRNGVDWLNLNRKGGHWSKEYKTKQAWQQIAMVQCTNFRIPRELPPCNVQFTYFFQQERSRDGANWIVDKPVIDYLVKQWRCWPDDTTEWITVLPNILLVRPSQPEGVIMRAYPKEA